MPHEVKMPQLGMAQASGVIVSWLRDAGDAVNQGDALFEVETDKATMEVEAPVGGWLAGVRAGEGDDVPVGDVIALIVESEGEVGEHDSAAATPKAKMADEPEESDKPSTETALAPEPSSVPSPAQSNAPVSMGRVLASPKAKRLALEKGIDLAGLRAQGVPEPIRAADLAKGATGGQSFLAAEVSGDALNALLAHSEQADRTSLLAAFAAGAWRAQFGGRDVGVALRGLDGTTAMFGNADGGAELALVDLCETRLTAYAPAGAGSLLAVARRGDRYALTLSFSETTLPMADAVALLDDIAARVEDPIRQLL